MNSSPEQLAKICVNIVLIAMVAISAIRGWRKGLAAVVFSCFRWIICVVGAIFAAFPVKDYLINNTDIEVTVTNHFRDSLASIASGSSFFSSAPKVLHSVFTTYQQNSVTKLTNSMSDTLIKVLAFLLAFFALMIVTKIIEIGLSMFAKKKDKDKNAIELFNSFMGGMFGLVRGVFVVSLLMLMLYPILSFADPKAVSPIVNGIRESEVAGLLYDHNPILLFFQMF